MNGQYKARIIEDPMRLKKSLFLFARIGDKTEVLYSNEAKIIDEGEAAEPTLRLDEYQLQALADELNNLGIHPRKEFVEGKLEATEAHLKDMRTLLKL